MNRSENFVTLFTFLINNILVYTMIEKYCTIQRQLFSGTFQKCPPKKISWLMSRRRIIKPNRIGQPTLVRFCTGGRITVLCITVLLAVLCFTVLWHWAYPNP
jgi:hypothetical protein